MTTSSSTADMDEDYPQQAVHYEAVQRNGRSASLIRDSEGHLAYPSEVPPRIEGLEAHEGQAKAPAQAPAQAQPEGGSAGQSTAVSEPSSSSQKKRTRLRTASTGANADNTTTGTTNTDARRRKRAATTSTPHVSLIQELRRTNSLLWSIPDLHDLGSGSGSSEATDGLGGIPLSDLSGADVEQQQQQQQQQQQPDTTKAKKRARFGRKQAQPHVPSMSFAHWRSQAHFRRDGRLPISVKDTSHTGYLAKAVGAAVSRISTRRSGDGPNDHGTDDDDDDDDEDESTSESDAYDANGQPRRKPGQSAAAAEFGAISRQLAHMPCPRLNIVIMIIGSRGDAQPFLKIGKVLKEQYGHRVRVATHPAFKDFIEKDAGLEFFSVGGDPAELMAFIVKNPGLIPSLASVKAGDIGRRRDAMAEMFEGFWRACVDATDDPRDVGNLRLMGDKEPFVADAIIANPPSFAHVHCAEALGIPLHLMFPFPYTPTQAFPHPLANITKPSVDPGYTNFISYPLIDMMIWQGLGDLMNNLRTNVLDLDPIDMVWAPGAVYRMHVPFTYLFSPGLIPKPSDWGPEIDIAGFVFLDLASSFTPPADLAAFLAASDEPPIYIGFGSIVVDDPGRFTEIIYEAIQATGVRALISRGWGGLGASDNVPDNVFLLGNIPHDWLFPQVRACIIHGGAGTTAIALKCGLPTMAVPFFGDQHFWGAILHKTKVGPAPIPYKQLTVENLSASIRYLLSDEAKTAAQTIADAIAREGDGAANACRSFVRTLELEGHHSMRCAVFPDRVAVWLRKGSDIKLSALAADALVAQGYVSYGHLRLLRHTDWNDFEGPGEPVTAVFGSLARLFRDAISVPMINAMGKLFGGGGGSGGGTAGDKDGAEGGTAKAQPGSFEDVFSAVRHGVGQSASAFAMAPIDLYFALCQGFHNAPRLYGDDTVRRPPHVTGFKSGLVAAGNELVLGVYDGVTGLVRLPVRGARQDGVRGALKGTSMGVLGFVLKDLSAVLSPLGYVLKGLAKQATRARQPATYLRRVRIVQGQREMRALGDKQREQVRQRAATGWEALHALHRVVQGKGLKEGKEGGKTGKALDEQALAEAGQLSSSAADGAGAHHRRGSASGGGGGLALVRPPSNDSAFRHHHHAAVAPRPSSDYQAALESADLAAVALAALRRGESLDSVVQGRHACRRRGKNCRPYNNPFPADERSREQMLLDSLAKQKKERAQLHGPDVAETAMGKT